MAETERQLEHPTFGCSAATHPLLRPLIIHRIHRIHPSIHLLWVGEGGIKASCSAVLHPSIPPCRRSRQGEQKREGDRREKETDRNGGCPPADEQLLPQESRRNPNPRLLRAQTGLQRSVCLALCDLVPPFIYPSIHPFILSIRFDPVLLCRRMHT